MNAVDKLFAEIKDFVAQGNDINSFYEDKSVLYEFLDHYYQHVIYKLTTENENFYGDDYSDELLLPLVDRSYDILSKLQWMFDNGADPNAGGEWVPLMSPVAFLDDAMTEFLLEHGANALFDTEDEGGIPYGCGNYYIDDLDVTALNYSFEPNAKKVIFDQILKIATLFAKCGVTDVHTHCISIDREKRTVSVTQARVKY